MKTTQVTGYNNISVVEISTEALKSMLRFKEARLIQMREEIDWLKEELGKRGE